MKLFQSFIKKLLVIIIGAFLMCLNSCSDMNTEEMSGKSDIKALSDVSQIGDNKYSCSYDGVSHEFILYLPDQPEDAPLVLMLHGYGESAETFRDVSHFHEAAVPEGYAVCYVTGAANPNDPTSSSGWNSGIAQGGNDDLSFLLSLTDYLRTEYKLSPDKLFAIGFSNGGFMIHRLAIEAGDSFTGLISVAGKMPESIWAERDTGFYTSFFQVMGEKDDVVPLNSSGTAKYTKDPAIEDVIDFWVEKAGLDNINEEDIGNGSILTKYSSDSVNINIWNLLIKDARHSWPDESVNKININKYIIEFMNNLK